MHLARNCAPGALHNVDLITDMVLQMVHRNTSSINTSAVLRIRSILIRSADPFLEITYFLNAPIDEHYLFILYFL